MNDLGSRLLDVLTREADMLRSSKLERMQALLEEKQALIADLEANQVHLPVDLLTDLRAIARRNDILYGAALDGLQIVRDRLETLRDAEGGLTTYGYDGRKLGLPIAGASRETLA